VKYPFNWRWGNNLREWETVPEKYNKTISLTRRKMTFMAFYSIALWSGALRGVILIDRGLVCLTGRLPFPYIITSAIKYSHIGDFVI
jgi:hypothetical protein